MKSTSAIKPRQMMRGHTGSVGGVAHLPDRRRIITCSTDGSLRLWNVESGVQIGNDWRDDEGGDGGDGDEAELCIMALSPNGKTVASGSTDGKVRLWDVETKKVVARWTGHIANVTSLCWSVDGERVVSGAYDTTIRVWDVESGDTVLGPINTGHQLVFAVIYSPDKTKIATGGSYEDALKIWDAKTGSLLSTIKHDSPVWSLAWTSDQKKLITGSYASIRIFDTATWQQIAILEGHRSVVISLSLFQNDRLLASGSDDLTARLWNLDTNLPVGPPIEHENEIRSAAISADGTLLLTGCGDNNAYVWDIHTTLKDAGLEDLLSILDVPPDGMDQTISHSQVTTRKSLMEADATRRLAKQEYADRPPPRFFDDARDGVQSSAPPVAHSERRLRGFAPFSVFRANVLPSLFRSPQSNIPEATALQPPPRRSVSSRNRTRVVNVPAAQDRQPLYVAPRPQPPGNKGKDDPQQEGQSGSHVYILPVARDSQPVYVAPRPQPPGKKGKDVPQQEGQSGSHVPESGAAGTQSQPAGTGKNPPWWVPLVSFVCCAPTPEGR